MEKVLERGKMRHLDYFQPILARVTDEIIKIMLKEKIVIVDPAKKQKLVSEVAVDTFRKYSTRSQSCSAKEPSARSTS